MAMLLMVQIAAHLSGSEGQAQRGKREGLPAL